MSKKLAGKKYAGSHTTVIDAAYDLVCKLERNTFVNKISLGIIRQCRTGRGAQNIKTKDTSSGLEVIVRGSAYVQTIYLYIEDPDSNRSGVSHLIEKEFKD